MFARPFQTSQPRHARLFELIRQGEFAGLVSARQTPAEPLDANAQARFIRRAQRSLR